MVRPASDRVLRARSYSGTWASAVVLPLPGCHGLRRRVPKRLRVAPTHQRVNRQVHRPGPPTPLRQELPPWHRRSLGSPRFVRHYYGDTICSSGYVRCFSWPGALRRARRRCSRMRAGCPIRRSRDQCVLAAPPRFSQRCHVRHRPNAPRHPSGAPSVLPELLPTQPPTPNDTIS